MTSTWTGFSSSPLAAGIDICRLQTAPGFHLRTTESVLRLLDQFLVEQHIETLQDVLSNSPLSVRRCPVHAFPISSFLAHRCGSYAPPLIQAFACRNTAKPSALG